jgi:hypothetical protein
MHDPMAAHGEVSRPRREAGPGPLARLIAVIITAGLAWAIVIAVGAWLVGLLIARG